ncbi:MAG: hypothetical protein ACFFEK_07595, partial [Candidatus Thorarchaeota archaeon]
VTIAGAFIAYLGLELGGGFFESAPIVVASIALTAVITGILFKRKTEGQESDVLQDILEEELLDDDEQMDEGFAANPSENNNED